MLRLTPRPLSPQPQFRDQTYKCVQAITPNNASMALISGCESDQSCDISDYDSHHSTIGLTRSTSSYTTLTETENETPPESPVRATNLVNGVAIVTTPSVPHSAIRSIEGDPRLLQVTSTSAKPLVDGLKRPVLCRRSSGHSIYSDHLLVESDDGYEAEAEGLVRLKATRPRPLKLESSMWRKRGNRDGNQNTNVLPLPYTSNRPPNRPFQIEQQACSLTQQTTNRTQTYDSHTVPVALTNTKAANSLQRSHRPHSIDLSGVFSRRLGGQPYAGLGLGLPSTSTSRLGCGGTNSSNDRHSSDRQPCTNLHPNDGILPLKNGNRTVSAPSPLSPRASPIFPSHATFPVTDYPCPDLDVCEGHTPRLTATSLSIQMPLPPHIQATTFPSDEPSPLDLPSPLDPSNALPLWKVKDGFPLAIPRGNAVGAYYSRERITLAAGPSNKNAPFSSVRSPLTTPPPSRTLRTPLHTLKSRAEVSRNPGAVVRAWAVSSTSGSLLKDAPPRGSPEGKWPAHLASPICTPLRLFMAACPAPRTPTKCKTTPWGSPIAELTNVQPTWNGTPLVIHADGEQMGIAEDCCNMSSPSSLVAVTLAKAETPDSRPEGTYNFNPYFASAVA